MAVRCPTDMREPKQCRTRQRQQGCANGQLLPVKHLELLDKFLKHAPPGQIGDDSGRDCRIAALIVPNWRIKQTKKR
jgi:hypothetical protein